MREKLQKYTGYFLFVLAILFISDGLYIKIKAVLAQHLLKHAWEQSVSMQRPVKPWPWSDSHPVARLQVERLGIDCIVLEGESGEVLAFGPGHLSESADPVAEGNCALVGHRDTSFGFLKELEIGDVLTLQNVFEQKRSYEVMSMTVKEHQKLFLEETVTPWLTLITCYPFEGLKPGTNLRFVVFAREMAMISSLLASTKD